MFSRRSTATTRTPPANRACALTGARDGSRYRIMWMARPGHAGDDLWRATLLRLEELGLFKGALLEKAGSLGLFGAVIVKAAGSRVAVSRDLARSILVKEAH